MTPILLLAALQVQVQEVSPPPAEPVHAPSPERVEQAPDAAVAQPTPPVPPTLTPQVSGRAAENVVTQAEDAFGFSVGRETLGLYSSSNVRGFSPFAAGNVRIECLYFDSFLTPIVRLRQSTSIRVGLSAQEYPFPSPTGIVDYSFRKPGGAASLSMLVSSGS